MADLFNYTRSQSMVTPQSPFVQATPAKSSFSNISKLVEFAQKAQLATLSQQSTDLTAQQKAANIENEAALVDSYLVNDSKQAVMYQDYVASYRDAGADLTKKQAVTNSYLTESEDHYSSLPSVVQAKLITAKQAMNANANNQFLKDELVFKQEDFSNQVSLTVPTIQFQDAETQNETYKQLQAKAEALNISKNDFGNFYTTSRINFALDQLNGDDLSLDANKAYVEMAKLTELHGTLKSISPFSTDVLSKFKDKIQSLKNAVDSGVESTIKDSINNLQKDRFDEYVALGVANKAINKEQATSYAIDYGQQEASSGVVNQRTALEIYNATGGVPFVDSNLGVDPKVQTILKQKVTDSIVSNLYSPNPNLVSLKAQATTNPELYKKEWSSAFNNSMVKLVALASDAKTNPDVLKQAIIDMETKTNAAFGNMSKDDRIKMFMVKGTILSNPTNLAERMRILETAGEFTAFPTSNKDVKALLLQIPLDSHTEANALYSAFVKSGQWQKTEATDVVRKMFVFQNVEDNRGAISPQLIDKLSEAGMTAPNLPSFEKALLSSFDDSEMQQQKKAEVDKALAGTEPTISYINNSIYIKNKDGDTASIVLNPNSLKSLVTNIQETGQQKAARGVTQAGAQIQGIVSEVSKFSNTVYEFGREFFTNDTISLRDKQAVVNMQTEYTKQQEALYNKKQWEFIDKQDNTYAMEAAKLVLNYFKGVSQLGITLSPSAQAKVDNALSQAGRFVGEIVFDTISGDAYGMGNLDVVRRNEQALNTKESLKQPSFKNTATTLQPIIAQIESSNQHIDPATGKLIVNSKTGALGKYQLMPATAKQPGYGVKPLQNNTEQEHARFYTDYMSAMLKTFNGDIDKATAAYNHGVGNVKKAIKAKGNNWLSVMPDETKKYVKQVRQGLLNSSSQ